MWPILLLLYCVEFEIVMVARSVFLLLAWLSCYNLSSQEINFKIGCSIDFGNEVKRIGLQFDLNGQHIFAQLNLMTGVYYNFSSWGIKSRTPEVKLGVGAHFGIGDQDNMVNPFFGLEDHNLVYDYGIGYVYQYYFDKQGTSQTTGLLIFNHKNVTVMTENDLLGGGKGWRDRYRTGALKINYRYGNFKFGAYVQLYTGDYASCSKIKDNVSYPARYGYRSQDNAIFGGKSFGILSLQSEYVGPYHQSARIDVGLNSEKIRHFVQNKALHDMPFFTDKMVKRELMHIPMLQPNSDIYTFEKGQTIKPASLYYNMSLNPSAFY